MRVEEEAVGPGTRLNECREIAVNTFFLHAEDGIRDGTVTGVQTCALPILLSSGFLHIHTEQVETQRNSTTSGADKREEVVAPPPPPKPQRSLPQPSKPAEGELPTFSAKVDAAALSSVLVAAAAQGRPFCPI